MAIEITNKIPLIKVRRETTRSRVLKLHGSKLCVIYSEVHEGYKRGDDWVQNINEADVDTFSLNFEKTKSRIKEGIVYCMVKI